MNPVKNCEWFNVKKTNWITRREEWDKKGLSFGLSSAKLGTKTRQESCFSTSWLNIHSHWSETLVAYKRNETEHRPFTTARQTIYRWRTPSIEGWLMLTDTKGREKEFVTNFVVHSSTGLACKSIYFHLISKNSILGYRNQNFRNRNVSLEIFDLRSWKNILKRAVSIAKIILENTFTNIMSKSDSSEE